MRVDGTGVSPSKAIMLPSYENENYQINDFEYQNTDVASYNTATICATKVDFSAIVVQGFQSNSDIFTGSPSDSSIPYKLTHSSGN